MSQQSSGKYGKPSKVETKKKPSLETWVAAVAAVNAGMTLKVAAETYHVSREPLRLRVKGIVPLDAKSGPQLVYLSDSGSRGVEEIIRYRALHGMCVGFEELRCMIREAAETTGTRPLTDDFPNDKYVHRCEMRCASTPDVVMNYYNNLKYVMRRDKGSKSLEKREKKDGARAAANSARAQEQAQLQMMKKAAKTEQKAAQVKEKAIGKSSYPSKKRCIKLCVENSPVDEICMSEISLLRYSIFKACDPKRVLPSMACVQ